MAEAETEPDQASMERMLQQAGFTTAPQSVEDERLLRKQKLAATFRIFGRFGFDEGVAPPIGRSDIRSTRSSSSCSGAPGRSTPSRIRSGS